MKPNSKPSKSAVVPVKPQKPVPASPKKGVVPPGLAKWHKQHPNAPNAHKGKTVIK